MTVLKGKEQLETVFSAFSEQLEARGIEHLELVVCGGAALNVLGFVDRTTRDVDVIAFIDTHAKGQTALVKPDFLHAPIREAINTVQRDFNLPENWLNAGPASVLDFGLPQGLMDRTETRKFGKTLVVHFLGRYDQIHFKLYAAVDQAGGKHLDDLLVLHPTGKEIKSAAQWSMTQDPSEGFKMVLKDFLSKIGFKHVAEQL